MKILFAHLLNNYTGSPRVLANELHLLNNNKDLEISLLTSKTDGLLSNIENVKYYYNGYKWSNNKIILAFLLLIAQIRSFFFVLFHNYDVIYINTILPFGAAIAAKLKHNRIIYHVHEVYINPNILKRFSLRVMLKCADEIICVSKYVQENIDTKKINLQVIYNPIRNNEIPEEIDKYLREKFDNRIIFMPTSLKEYKGINQFVELARKNINYKFKLLCSAPIEEIKEYYSKIDLPNNIELIGKQPDLTFYYKKATVSMNLSLQDKCIETFGLTIPEGFDELTPAIAPAFGGPKEIIDDGKNGFLINPYDIEQVSKAIKNITKDFEIYKKFAINAKKSLSKFSEEEFIAKIMRVLNA